MQSKKTFFVFLLGVVVYTSCAKRHHETPGKQTQSKVQNNDHEESSHARRHHVREINAPNTHHHHHQHKRESKEVNDQIKLPTGSDEHVKPEQHLNDRHQAVKRQDGNGQEGANSQESSSNTSTPTPPDSSPPSPISDLLLDVGKVTVESQTDSCNGVLLEPTFVLTSATCVYPNHTADPFEDITFSMGQETKPVKQVFRNPYWHLTGERKENFALLQLQHAVANVNQKVVTSMTWSSYALEDIGDSFIGIPDATGSGCTAASKAARNSDVIRHVSDELITLSCVDTGTIEPGSPIFRLVDGAPFIYGVYFGHCATGSLDRATSGSCGARISKQVFLDFCLHAKTEHVDLIACDSKLLNLLHTNFPTTVFTNESFSAVHERDSNSKNVLLAYHSSASKQFQTFAEDMETIQRLKSVHDKFQVAVIDVNILPYQVKAVPFIEYRTKSSNAYFPYNDEYNFMDFRKFMDVFGKVGAPPAGSISFLQNIHLVKRSDAPGTTRQGVNSVQIPAVQSSSIPDSAGAKFINKDKRCDTTAGYWMVPDESCTCLPTHFGAGRAESGAQCEELTSVLKANCEYHVGGSTKTYQQIMTEANDRATWCGTVKSIAAIAKTTAKINAKTLTPEDCADAVIEKITCATNHRLQIVYDSSPNTTANDSLINRRSPVNTKKGAPPPNYLSNFEGNSPPEPITHAPNTHYFTVTEQATQSATPYSVLFDGNRGIPVIVGFKLNNANMKAITRQKSWLRNRWTKPTSLNNVRTGSNEIYFGRGKKASPKAVMEGQLNPVLMHSYGDTSMDLTFNHLNGFPQYADFAEGLWRDYQQKIIQYAKETCSTKDASATFYVVSGVSDYEINGVGSSAFLKQAIYWPVAYDGAIAQPNGSPTLAEGVQKSVIIPKSVWTVGCCTWTASGEAKAETVSIWANNKPRGVPKHEIQPELHTLASRLFPGKSSFHFFPANPQCNNGDNHFTMEP